MNKYYIIETLPNGYKNTVTELQNNYRYGWHRVTKYFNSERGAKIWITRRKNKIIENGTENVNNYLWEIKMGVN